MKAIIPAAGFGTRFLPLTKAQPKEMLPVVNKPTIQWVVEEAVDAGITDIAIITGKHKQAIENHFSPMEELEEALEKAGKVKELEEIRKINEIANLEFIIQEEQKGLGHAILCAEEFVGDSPFAVLLGDTICTGNPNCTKGLVNLFNDRKASIFSVEKIKPEETLHKGFVLVDKGIASGPMSGFLWIFQEWLSLILSFGIRPLKNVLYFVIMFLTFPLKFLDLILIYFPGADNLASNFYYIGKKE